MTREEPTDHARLRRIIANEVKLPSTGVITKVYEHREPADKWNFHVDVKVGPDDHPRKVPVLTNTPGLITPPRSQEHPDGPDLALVQYMGDDETSRPVVTGILYSRENRPALGKEGIYRLRRGSLFLEAHEQGDWIRFAKKPSDEGSADAKVELDSEGNITIGGSGARTIVDTPPKATLYQSESLEDGGTDTFDWNTTDWTAVPWDSESTNDDAFSTTTSATGDSYIEVLEDGTYRVTVEGLFYTAGSNISIAKRITKNGNSLGSLNTSDDSTGTGDQVPGALHMGPMVGVSSNHANASTEFSVELDLVANDTIRVETRENAATGSLFPIGTHTTFTVEQLWMSEQ